MGRLCGSAQPTHGQSHPSMEGRSVGSSMAPSLCSGHIQAVRRSVLTAAPRLRPSAADAKLRRKLKWHKCNLQSSPWALSGLGWASAAQLQKPVVQRLSCRGFQKSRHLHLPCFRSCSVCVHTVTQNGVTFKLGFIAICARSLKKKGKMKEKLTDWGVVELKLVT